MTAVIKYSCSNEECDFNVSLNNNMPVWTDDCPNELRKLPVSSSRLKYVTAYDNEEYCLRCGMKQKIRRRVETQSTLRKIFNRIIGRKKTNSTERYICIYCNHCDSFIKKDVFCSKCKLGTLSISRRVF